MEDMIYRQQAIDALAEQLYHNEDDYRTAVKAIGGLPSVQPETPPYVEEIENECKKWVSMPHINKPLAKALYEVWKKHDREDVSRNG